MCTGIFLFKPRPILALNFDYNRTFRLTLENGLAFCMRIRYDHWYGLPLGVHKEGRSANIQIAPYLEKGICDPDAPGTVQIPQIVRRILLQDLDIPSLPAFLATHRLTYSQENAGVHCLCADRNGRICILDPGTGYLTEDVFPDGFAVLTNFTLARHLPAGSGAGHVPCRRYRTAYAMLLEDRTGTDRLMTILEAVKQTEGKLPTIFSMVAELDTGNICFTLDGDFSKRYVFSFSDNCLCAGKGHRSAHRIRLTPEGISAAELKAWM